MKLKSFLTESLEKTISIRKRTGNTMLKSGLGIDDLMLVFKSDPRSSAIKVVDQPGNLPDQLKIEKAIRDGKVEISTKELSDKYLITFKV